MMSVPEPAAARVFRESSGRAVATLAFAVAIERWPADGLPPNPGGWIVTTARRKALVRACLRRNQPGPYQIQAAIAAVHSDAKEPAQTDWRQILALYDQLSALTPTPVVALYRAVALAEVAGPATALEAVDELPLGRYHLYHATRADLLRRLNRNAKAAAAYDEAIALAENAAERTFLTSRRATL